MWVGLIHSVEGLKSKVWSFPKKKQCWFKVATSHFTSISGCQPASQILTCQPCNHMNLSYSSLFLSSLLLLSLCFPFPFFPAPIGSVSPESPHTPLLSIIFPALRVTVTLYNCLSLELLPAPLWTSSLHSVLAIELYNRGIVFLTESSFIPRKIFKSFKI